MKSKTNQSIETDSEMTQITELVEKDIKVVSILYFIGPGTYKKDWTS